MPHFQIVLPYSLEEVFRPYEEFDKQNREWGYDESGKVKDRATNGRLVVGI